MLRIHMINEPLHLIKWSFFQHHLSRFSITWNTSEDSIQLLHLLKGAFRHNMNMNNLQNSAVKGFQFTFRTTTQTFLKLCGKFIRNMTEMSCYSTNVLAFKANSKWGENQRESGVPGCGLRAAVAADWSRQRGGRSSVSGSCWRLSGFSDSRCEPPLRVYSSPDGTCTGGDRAAAFPLQKPPQRPGSKDPSCLLLSAIVLLAFIAALCSRPTTAGARTALWAAPGGGWVICSGRGRGLCTDHAPWLILTTRGLLTVFFSASSQRGGEVASHMEAKHPQNRHERSLTSGW